MVDRQTCAVGGVYFASELSKANERSPFILLIESHKTQESCIFTAVSIKHTNQVKCIQQKQVNSRS